jgi:hypothetical protein
MNIHVGYVEILETPIWQVTWQTIQQPFLLSRQEMWFTGKVDQKACEMIEERGWKVVENANNVLIKK